MDKEMFQFYKNALMNNLCDEYKGMWQTANTDKEKLVKLAMMQQSIPYVATYCYNGNGLTKEYIETKFKDYINGKKTLHDCDGINGYTYGLYVGYSGDINVCDDVLSLMWCNDTLASVDTSKCPIIYVNNKSTCYLAANGYNTIRVYLFDESEINLSDIDETSEVVIYRYSANCRVVLGKYCLGRVKQFNKKLVL